jgi:hypothetical protein
LIGGKGDRADLGGNDAILVPGETKEAQAPFLTNDLALVDAKDKIRWMWPNITEALHGVFLSG